MQIKIGDKEVNFQIDEKTNNIFCTSLDIARVFDKNHKDVLKNIDLIIEQICKTGCLEQKRNFSPMLYQHKLGNSAIRQNRMFYLSRDGFSLVAMSFTGIKALKWKISFIEAFSFMENELHAIKATATATLNQPKEVFNLIYETPCRDAVLNAVANLEKENKAKARKIKEYEITEKFNGKKITTDVKVGVDWHTPSLFSPKEL